MPNMNMSLLGEHRLSVMVAAAGVVVGAGLYGLFLARGYTKAKPEVQSVVDGLLGLVGNTPLMELRSLNAATGCRILAKAEHLSPGGSIKDRIAKAMVLAAEADGKLTPGKPGTVVEGTGGNTGIGLALIARARGYKCILSMPEDISAEKIQLMRTLGAEVRICPCVPFKDPRHYVHEAERAAKESENAVLMMQFENLANYKCHEATTAAEIWMQSKGELDAFVCAVGTGGTIAGVSNFLKKMRPTMPVWAIDPTGSGIKNYIETGVFESSGSCYIEGIGIMRKTANFAEAKVDGAFRGTDREAVEMGHWLVRHEGLFVGPSAALNVCGAVKLARLMGPGHTIVTVLCDGGDRYRSKMYNPKWLEEKDLVPKHVEDISLEFVQ
mmetsp:Transcript_43675/g.83347  ORF Transcript_43675/g.83347 Transcript_43675/m.83347 type:complete len:383 (-) Transcript_43675:1523-2671(-)